MLSYAALAALFVGSALVRAELVPTAPGPGDVFKEGGLCTFTWTPDTTGVWKNTSVELMSGSNWEMVHITTVANFDGTDSTKTDFSYNCPQVTPNSAIYFYQFSNAAAPSNLTWTTRFTIAGADGSTTAPANSTEPDGSAIPWGIGALVDPSQAVAPPSYLASGSTGTSAGSSAAAAPATGASAPAATSSGSAAATGPAAPAGSTSSKFSTAPAAPTGAAQSANTTTTSNSSAAANNGASSLLGSDSYVVRAGIALGIAAFTFAIAL